MSQLVDVLQKFWQQAENWSTLTSSVDGIVEYNGSNLCSALMQN